MITRNRSVPLWVVVAAAALLRLVFFSTTSLPDLLASRPELSTPITSFRSLREGVYHHRRDKDPYQGGVFHHSPLYLLLFTQALPISSHPATCLFWTATDTVAALALTALAGLISTSSEPDKRPRRRRLVALIYLFNPYTLATCLARSTTAIDNALLSLAFYATVAGLDHFAYGLLAIAVHTSLYPILLLPAMVRSLALQSRKPFARSVQGLTIFLGITGLLAALNVVMAGTGWARQTWGTILGVTDLTPNSGMWWYLVTEMFDHFRPFFVGVFQLHNAIYVLPICLRLRDEPLLAMCITAGIFCTWKSYPSVGDLGLWAGLLSCFPSLSNNLRHPLFTVTVYLYTLILLPLLHSLWLLTGTGNSNFFYAATMVHGLNSSLAIVDVLGAVLRRRVRGSVGARWDNDKWQIVQLNKAG